MKLIVIGRNPQEATIVLNSQYISNYHAEIILLDNGDMFLVDKSTNGTFLNGVRLAPGKEVAVKRGDNVMFADVALDWNSIDPIRVPSDVKSIIGVGSHYMNKINVQGQNVSRFHATIRQTADGKWYICDHSKNGTTVNNARIPKDRFIRINKGDEIACAGVPIQNPIPSNNSWKWSIITAAVACVAALAIIFWPEPKWPDEKISETYSPAVALIVTGYHFEVSCSGLDLERMGEPTSFGIINGDIIPDLIHVTEGTGFFIGENGHVVTNRHVARPWEYMDNKYVAGVESSSICEYAEVVYREYILSKHRNLRVTAHLSGLKVKGVVDGIYIVPCGSYYEGENSLRCSEVAVSDNKDHDLAILKVRNNMMPTHITTIPLDKIYNKELTVGNNISTLGFPQGTDFQKYKEEPLQIYFSKGRVNTMHSTVEYGVDVNSEHGASGSPVFDEYGNVVAIIHAGYDGRYNQAIKAKYLVELINKANITK